MPDLELTEFLFDTIETLLTICREQNAKLSELDAVIAADRIEEVEDKYIRKVYPEGGDQNE